MRFLGYFCDLEMRSVLFTVGFVYKKRKKGKNQPQIYREIPQKNEKSQIKSDNKNELRLKMEKSLKKIFGKIKKKSKK